MYDLVMFGLDGILIDTTPEIRDVVKRASVARPRHWKDYDIPLRR
jgi:beta-phosphoglucomutase-like phosphatase (HAD superfamily)